MALTPPTVDELRTWKQETGTGPDAAYSEFLQAATDMVEIATGISQQPTSLLEQRLLRRAILDLAWYIGTSMEERDAIFSAFSSERIGSYSYSKAQRAAEDKAWLGVPFFDQALAYFENKKLEAEEDSWSSSLQMFPTVPTETWRSHP